MASRSAVLDAANEVRDRMESRRQTLNADQRKRLREREQNPIAYYESSSGTFYTPDTQGRWIRFTESSLRRLMARTIYAGVTKEEGRDQEMDDHFIALQTQQNVAAAFPLAGFPAGYHHINGERILVTREATAIKPCAGEWKVLQGFLSTLLGDQVERFYGWTKAAFKSLHSGAPFRPGQLLALAGPPGCGKSLLQGILTEIFGGRSAKPYQFMTGRTAFNSELFYAEHLAIEDEAASTQIADRRAFGASIKNMLVNETQVMYRKGRESLTLTPFWRISLSVNDEPESLMVLPPIDSDLADKITLLKCFRAEFTFDMENDTARKDFRKAITAELPHFLFWLRGWTLPIKMRDSRYGVKAYQNPELLEALAGLAPESTLLALIDALRPWGLDNQPFVGTALKLQEELLQKDKLGRVEKLLKFNSACGVYLARLNKMYPARVEMLKRDQNKATWKVNPPVEDSADNESTKE